MPSIRENDGLPNLDATDQATDAESNEQAMVLTRERNSFTFNINKEGYVIFSVSCTYSMLPHDTNDSLIAIAILVSYVCSSDKKPFATNIN